LDRDGLEGMELLMLRGFTGTIIVDKFAYTIPAKALKLKKSNADDFRRFLPFHYTYISRAGMYAGSVRLITQYIHIYYLQHITHDIIQFLDLSFSYYCRSFKDLSPKIKISIIEKCQRYRKVISISEERLVN